MVLNWNNPSRLSIVAVISHAFKFVFIKTHKTGGTAIETCLSAILPDSDILTPIFPDEGEGHMARNYKTNRGVIRNHMSASKVIKLLDNDCRDYFFWCVEREPIEKCLSFYAMLKNSPHFGKDCKDMTWEDYLKRGDFPIDSTKYYSQPNSPFSKENILVDQIIDYHNIRDNLPVFLKKRFGIKNFNLNKSNAKSGFRDKKNIPTINEVSQQQRNFIYSRFEISNQICKEFGIDYHSNRYNMVSASRN